MIRWMFILGMALLIRFHNRPKPVKFVPVFVPDERFKFLM